MIFIKKNGIEYKWFNAMLLTLLIITLSSCSTIYRIDRAGKDTAIDCRNFEEMNGRYTNLNIQSAWTIYGMLYDRKFLHKKLNTDSVEVVIKAINDKRIKLSFVKGSSILRQQKLRGEFVDGYFSVNPKIGFLSPFFPILWGAWYL